MQAKIILHWISSNWELSSLLANCKLKFFLNTVIANFAADSVSTSSEDSMESQELDGSENQAMNKNISLPTYPASKKVSSWIALLSLMQGF